MKKVIKIDEIDVRAVVPDAKDFERADSLQFQGRTFKGDCSGFEGQARRMAKAIKNPLKLVRRTMAVVNVYGAFGYMNYGSGVESCIHADSDVFRPFATALVDMGFSKEQIEQVIVTGYNLK